MSLAPGKAKASDLRTRTCDVLVIGGGPGGSAAATFLAGRGLDIVVVEKDRHPRFHIGESLLPGSLPILEELGVLDRVREIGIYKPGAEIISEDGSREVVFEFRRALLGGPDHAFQVLRSTFDHILFQRAAESGATTLEETSANVVTLDEEHAVVRTRSADGTSSEWRTRFLVDASGRSTVVSKMLSQRNPDKRNTSAAVFGHFRGLPRFEGERGGNIRIYLTTPGWMWQIPLQNDITSVGLVAPGEHFRARGGSVDTMFAEHCRRHPHIHGLIQQGELVEPMRATGNFSYRSTTAAGGRHVKVGDAYGFLDPIFSSGVHLALCSAKEAATAIMAIMQHPRARAVQLAKYHKRNERRMDFVSWFVYHIHDPWFRHMIVNPRNTFGMEQAVISVLAGNFNGEFQISSRVALMKAIRRITAAINR